MSAVDSPPGVAFTGRLVGEFGARTKSRRLARRVFSLVLLASCLTLVLVARKFHATLSATLVVFAVASACVAGVGLAVRRARLTIDSNGVRWGWRIGGFRMRLQRIKQVTMYQNAIALEPHRGSIWYLSRRDWEDFDDFGEALATAAIPCKTGKGAAPIRARLQSYGLALDLLLVGDVLLAIATAIIAALR